MHDAFVIVWVSSARCAFLTDNTEIFEETRRNIVPDHLHVFVSVKTALEEKTVLVRSTIIGARQIRLSIRC